MPHGLISFCWTRWITKAEQVSEVEYMQWLLVLCPNYEVSQHTYSLCQQIFQRRSPSLDRKKSGLNETVCCLNCQFPGGAYVLQTESFEHWNSFVVSILGRSCKFFISISEKFLLVKRTLFILWGNCEGTVRNVHLSATHARKRRSQCYLNRFCFQLFTKMVKRKSAQKNWKI